MSEEVVVRLTRIEDKLDSALGVQKDHEDRIRGVEQKFWIGTGGVSAVSALLGTFLYKMFH
jgi:hypothetical protein